MMTYSCSHPSACNATTRDGLQPREHCAHGHAPCWWRPVPFYPTPAVFVSVAWTHDGRRVHGGIP